MLALLLLAPLAQALMPVPPLPAPLAPFERAAFKTEQGPAAQRRPATVPPEILDRFREALEKAMETDADGLTEAELRELLIHGLSAGLRRVRPHSSYMGPRELSEFRANQRNVLPPGVGAELTKVAEGAKVVLVIGGGPAEAGGLMDDDVIVKVAGQDVSALELDKIIDRIRGPQGTPVVLTVKRGQAEVTLPPIPRDYVHSPSVFARTFPANEVLCKRDRKCVGYVYLSHFGEDDGMNAARLIEGLRQSGAKRLVFDLRFNPGGDVDAVNEITSEFLRNGQTIVEFRRQGAVEDRHVTDGDGAFARMPVALMINGGSASASEIMAGAFQDHRRGRIFGRTSWGKGSRQTIIPVQSDSAVRITSARWFTPNGRSIQGRVDPKTELEIPGTGGIRPDEELPALSEEDETALHLSLRRQLQGRAATFNDAWLDRVVNYMRGLP